MNAGKILPYLDIPFQHANKRILKAMKRPASSENTLERIQQWRKDCPDLTLRSTFIVGFPGETEAEFQELLDFLDAAQLDRVGAFAYSPVEGAKANELADPVPPEIQQERLARFMAKQAEISTQRLKNKIGSVQEVLIDDIDDEGIVARSFADAPDIDGMVFVSTSAIPGGKEKIGDIIKVRITDSDEHDLWAVKINE
jgi:ribosomal protein S12 methylthiotransferase